MLRQTYGYFPSLRWYQIYTAWWQRCSWLPRILILWHTCLDSLDLISRSSPDSNLGLVPLRTGNSWNKLTGLGHFIHIFHAFVVLAASAWIICRGTRCAVQNCVRFNKAVIFWFLRSEHHSRTQFHTQIRSRGYQDKLIQCVKNSYGSRKHSLQDVSWSPGKTSSRCDGSLNRFKYSVDWFTSAND